MVFNKKIGIGIAMVVAAAIWFGGNYIVTQEIEESARAFLSEQDLEDVVHWESVKGRMNKTATFYNVVINGKKGEKKMSIKQIDVHDFDESDDSFLLDVSLIGIADEQGQSFTNVFAEQSNGLLEGVDRASLPLLNADILIQHVPNHSKFEFGLDQDKLISEKFSLKVSDTDAIFQALKHSEKEDDPLRVFRLLEHVKFEHAHLAVKEKGLLKYFKNKGMLDKIGTAEGCTGLVAIIGLEKGRQSCEHLFEFLTLKEDGLNISITAKEPHTLRTLLETGQGLSYLFSKNPAVIREFFKTFDIELSN